LASRTWTRQRHCSVHVLAQWLSRKTARLDRRLGLSYEVISLLLWACFPEIACCALPLFGLGRTSSSILVATLSVGREVHCTLSVPVHLSRAHLSCRNLRGAKICLLVPTGNAVAESARIERVRTASQDSKKWGQEVLSSSTAPKSHTFPALFQRLSAPSLCWQSRLTQRLQLGGQETSAQVGISAKAEVGYAGFVMPTISINPLPPKPLGRMRSKDSIAQRIMGFVPPFCPGEAVHGAGTPSSARYCVYPYCGDGGRLSNAIT
jgi:hypothetical protein